VPMVPSLCVIPMPPRITRESIRPRASDRSMVDTVQPHGLIRFETDRRRPYQRRCYCLDGITQGHDTVSHGKWDWMARINPRSGEERKMFLTCPFIDRAMFRIAQEMNCNLVRQEADLVLEPNVDGYRYDDFDHCTDLVRAGKFASNE